MTQPFLACCRFQTGTLREQALCSNTHARKQDKESATDMSLSKKEYGRVCLDLVMNTMMIDRKRKSLALFKGDLSINRKIDVASND